MSTPITASTLSALLSAVLAQKPTRPLVLALDEQCARVLAGLKPAGLFRYETRNRADLARRDSPEIPRSRGGNPPPPPRSTAAG